MPAEPIAVPAFVEVTVAPIHNERTSAGFSHTTAIKPDFCKLRYWLPHSNPTWSLWSTAKRVSLLDQDRWRVRAMRTTRASTSRSPRCPLGAAEFEPIQKLAMTDRGCPPNEGDRQRPVSRTHQAGSSEQSSTRTEAVHRSTILGCKCRRACYP